MGQNFRHLPFRYAVLLCRDQMVLERAVNQALAHQRGDRKNGAHFQRELILSGPDLTKKHIIVEFREFGGELPQTVSTCRLFYHCDILLTPSYF